MRRTALLLAALLAAGPALAQDKAGTPKAETPQPGDTAAGTPLQDPAAVQPAEPATVPMPEDPEIVPDVKDGADKPAADPKK